MSECLISSTNLKLKIRKFLRMSMIVNSNTRFFSNSLISFDLDSANIETRIENKRFSNWFEWFSNWLKWRSSSWRKTMISTKFWYLSDRRLAWVNLVIANDLVIASDLMISKSSVDKLFWWSDDWMSSISEIDWTFSIVDLKSLINSIRNDLITVIRKSIDSDDKTLLQVSSSISSSLNDSIHLSRWFRLFRHTNTSELRNKSWIEIIIKSFRMFNALTIWRSARNFLISIIAFSIIIARWVIDEIAEFMTCMRKYVSKISKINIKSSELTVSLIALTIICRTIFLLTSRFSKII
jgi:hypothetical protein